MSEINDRLTALEERADRRICTLEERVDKRFCALDKKVDHGFSDLTTRIDALIVSNNQKCAEHVKQTNDLFAKLLKKVNMPGKTGGSGILSVMASPWFKVVIGVIVSAIATYLGVDLTTGK